MATFEVQVPVQGEVIFTVEANSADAARDLAMSMDWADGEPNLDIDDGYEVPVIRL